MEKNPNSKRLKIIVVAALLLTIISMAAVVLFQTGYSLGTPTATFEKDNFFQYLCLHRWTPAGYCDICGLRCPHENWTEDHVCTFCQYQCRHEAWTDGNCDTCGLVCKHEDWEDGACKLCGLTCDHELWDDEGHCKSCGYACPHDEWEDGQCAVCGMPCDHADHDAETCICNNCGAETTHHYTNGVCSCSKTPDFVTEGLGSEWFQAAENAGTIEEVTYETADPRSSDPEDPAMTERKMLVYAPYGYTDEQKYNVLILIHGGGDDYTCWMDKTVDIDGISHNCARLYDQMVAAGLMQPTIIASINTSETFGGVDYDYDYTHLAAEIKGYIIPYIVDNYSTYAESSALEDIQAARQHMGIGGLSNGSLYTLNMVGDTLDVCGNYIGLSGNNNPQTMADALNAEAAADLPIYCFYAGYGSDDTQLELTTTGYDLILGQVDRLQEGKNAFCVEIAGAGHSWRTWTASIYNALQVAFQDLDQDTLVADAVPETAEADLTAEAEEASQAADESPAPSGEPGDAQEEAAA